MPSSLTLVLVSILLATAVVIFRLCLVILPARVAIPCPEECTCGTGGNDVRCYGTSLNPVPLIILTDVRVLWLNENKITLLEKDTFVLLTELKELYISKCGLRTIELGAFNGLTKLTRLFVGVNEISEITPGTFENMNSLEYLGLNNNRIEHLDSDVFNGLVNIKYIDLGQNNLLNLHPDTFLGLPNLQELYLFENFDLHIPTDRHFINSHSLSHLDISRCNVSLLSVKTFANVSVLEWLDLSYNKLRTVDINILRSLPKLSELYLYGNPLQCDCKLQEVWRWCEDHNIQTETGDRAPECDTPSEVKWGVSEKGKCLDDYIHYYGDYNSTNYSYTGTDHKYFYEYDDEFIRQYQVPLYIFPSIFGTISNVILLIIIICNKDMRTVPNMYLLNLAISDIIYLMGLFFEAFSNRTSGECLDGDFMCTFLPFCRRMSVGLSAYSVALFSFQRYRVTVNPFQVRFSSQAKWRVTVATICGVWIVAALFAIPSVLSIYMRDGFFFSRHITYYRILVIVEHSVSCFLPLFVIAFSYVMIARHLVESSRSISEGTQNYHLEKRRNTAKIVLGLTVVFLISYVPYHAFWAYINYTEIEQFLLPKNNELLDHLNYKLLYTYLISNCFLLVNSCLNPVALFCTSSPFRQHLKSYLTCFCKTNSPPTDLEFSRRK